MVLHEQLNSTRNACACMQYTQSYYICNILYMSLYTPLTWVTYTPLTWITYTPLTWITYTPHLGHLHTPHLGHLHPSPGSPTHAPHLDHLHTPHLGHLHTHLTWITYTPLTWVTMFILHAWLSILHILQKKYRL